MLCYRALEVIHGVLPMSLRGGLPIRDYVNHPKPNGYRSLHSKAVVDGSLVAEVQVRTVEMHNYAEYGRAAHWLYKHNAGRRQVAEGIWQRAPEQPELPSPAPMELVGPGWACSGPTSHVMPAYPFPRWPRRRRGGVPLGARDAVREGAARPEGREIHGRSDRRAGGRRFGAPALGA